jgi:hypothetical protein
VIPLCPWWLLLVIGRKKGKGNHEGHEGRTKDFMKGCVSAIAYAKKAEARRPRLQLAGCPDKT